MEFKQTGGVPKEILFDNMGTVVDINETGNEGICKGSKLSFLERNGGF
ncbi:hypothetical protein [Petrotoga sp. 9PW.55.5.1]